MRVYGLKGPGHQTGWWLSLFCLGLAILYPALPRTLLSLGYPGQGGPLERWGYLFVHSILASGGIVWQFVSYLHWQTFTQNSWSARTIFTEFAPFCFVPLILPVCVLLVWNRLVTNALRPPTVWRGLASVLLATICAGAFIFLLVQIGGRVLLHLMFVSLYANLEIRALMEITWLTALGQLALFVLPLLALGGYLAWHQQRRETRPRPGLSTPGTVSQGLSQSEKI